MEPKSSVVTPTVTGAMNTRRNGWLRPSALILIIVNLIPLGGVLFAGWEVFPVMLVYWFENLIIGCYNVLKILVCKGGPEGHAGSGMGAEKIMLIPFFIFHYGMFCMVHGMFVIMLFGQEADKALLEGMSLNAGKLLILIHEYSLGLILLSLAISHGFSFVQNYIRGGEYLHADPNNLLFSPYGRVVVLHITILAGGFFLTQSGSPTPILALLIIMKIILDLVFHLREHRSKS